MERHRLVASLAFGIATLVLATPLLTVAGFSAPLTPEQLAGPDEIEGPRTDTPAWTSDRWWTFNTSVGGEDPLLAAIIVHEADSDGIHVGMNRSGAILGLPFSGNLTPELAPEFAGETWKMYDFPLEDGDSWDQELLGHPLHTEVEAAELEDPDGNGMTEGYALEATAYGQTVAEYTYHPDAGWFDQLTIREPSTGDLLLDADLVAYGDAWDEAYYVNEMIHETSISYPTTLPGERTFTVPDTYESARVLLTAVAEAGAVDAGVQDGDGDTVATARTLGNGRDIASATSDTPGGTWTLSHAGTGDARVHLEVLGIRVVDPAHRSGGGLDSAVPTADVPGEDGLPSVGLGALG